MRTRHRVAGLLAIAVLAIALPASAQPGMTAPTNPPPVGPGAGPATGACIACEAPVERQGPFLSFGLDAAPHGVPVGDVQLGWMLAPWIGVFVSLDGVVAEDTRAHLWGAGLRLASGVAFAEVRILSVSNDGECYDGGCNDTPRIVMFGGGVELVRGQHAALDLHLHVLTDGRDAVPLVGLGLGFYF
ncbi:MAG TPA: hypothetical protein VF516_17780 [Kofleriaceae bacterium]